MRKCARMFPSPFHPSCPESNREVASTSDPSGPSKINCRGPSRESGRLSLMNPEYRLVFVSPLLQLLPVLSVAWESSVSPSGILELRTHDETGRLCPGCSVHGPRTVLPISTVRGPCAGKMPRQAVGSIRLIDPSPQEWGDVTWRAGHFPLRRTSVLGLWTGALGNSDACAKA